jgi:RimJ/RimL family protein N-acetyltransferase
MSGVEHFRTDRLTARDWSAGDDAAAYAIYGRDDVMRWLGPQPRRPVGSLTEMTERIEVMAARAAARPEFGLWPLELRSTGQVVGAVLLQPLPDGDSAGGQPPEPGTEVVEIGWHLNPDHWGRGYATEAGGGAIALAFSARDLDRVVAVAEPANGASLAVCRRLGMTHLGQTSQYFGLTLELFELVRGQDQGGADATMSGRQKGR